jgi:Holliday junction resolvasome RuvABC endonuclease subunit
MVYADTAKWSDLQAEVKNWITDNRNNEISVEKQFLSKKMDG